MAISGNQVMLIGFGIYILSAVLPGALENFFTTNTTTWDAGTAAIWGLIPLAVLFVIVRRYMAGGGNS